jgi:peroxiredoxin
MKKLSLKSAGAGVLVAILLATASSGAERDAKIEPKADAVLHKVADFYKDIKSFSTNASFMLNVQSTGMRREMWASYDIMLQRPNKVAMRLKDGVGATVISDGQKLFTLIPSINKYTEKDAPATVEEIFKEPEMTLVNRSLGDLLFLEKLMRPDSYATLTEGMTEAKYIDQEMQGGRPTHHLRVVANDLTWDMWVDEGAEPVVRKVSPDLSKSLADQLKGAPQMKEAKMQMTIRFDNWVVNKDIAAEQFVFAPPPESRKIASFFDKKPEGGDELTGKAAPEIKLELLDGGQMNLADHKGKNIVVLDFWATWCKPCVAALPISAEVVSGFKDRNVVFYAINEREGAEKIKEFLKQNNLSCNVGLDSDGGVAEKFGLTGIPTLIVIGKDGTIKSVHTGMEADLKAELTQELQAMVTAEEIQTSAPEKTHDKR